MHRVGVIGGGQLARMMQPAAIALGIDVKVLAEAEGSSAKSATKTWRPSKTLHQLSM